MKQVEKHTVYAFNLIDDEEYADASLQFWKNTVKGKQWLRLNSEDSYISGTPTEVADNLRRIATLIEQEFAK